ncbi:hypothetical protein H6777_01290 [Candidatus Nomurabacteria bacterium]|nr:hypothetical protein [Candidatus Nomurabacteria bacterium]
MKGKLKQRKRINRYVIAGYGLTVGFNEDDIRIEVSKYPKVIILSHENWNHFLNRIKSFNINLIHRVRSLKITSSKNQSISIEGQYIKNFLESVHNGAYDIRQKKI